MALRKQQAVFMLCWKVTTLRSLFIPIFNVVITLLNSIPLLVKLSTIGSLLPSQWQLYCIVSNLWEWKQRLNLKR